MGMPPLVGLVATCTSDNAPTFTPAREAAALGELLRASRERRGLTLRQVSTETKIPCRHLDALEHGNLAVVPGLTYQRGEVRAYAKAVGLDQHVALTHLERAVNESERSAIAPPMAHRGSQRARYRVRVRLLFHSRALIAIGAVALIGVVAGAAATRRVARGPQPEALRSTVAQAHVVASTSRVAASDPQHVAASTRATPVALPESAVSVQEATRTHESLSAANAPAVAAQVSASSEDRRGVGQDVQPPSSSQIATASGTSNGGLLVITDPPGARVTINGMGWGISPITISYLPPGPKRIRVTKEGYAAVDRVVHLQDPRTITVRVSMRDVR